MTNHTDNEVTSADIKAMNKAELLEFIEQNSLEVDLEANKTVAQLKTALLEMLDFTDTETAKPSGDVYTYIGAGADSPRIITLMGVQKFVRGQPTEVTEPALLAKLPGMATFVKGEADQETLHLIDEEGRQTEEQQRVLDRNAEKQYLTNLHKLKEAK